MSRALNLYLFMLREYANEATLKKIEKALRPPPSWRDPTTGLPAGWDDEADDWAQWERATAR